MISPVKIKLILFFTFVLLVGVGGYSLYRTRMADRASQAAERQFFANEEFQAEAAALLKEKSAPDLGAIRSLPDAVARFPKSIAAYEAIARDFRGTKSAYLGSLQMAHVFAALGPREEAAKWFDRAAESAANEMETAAVAIGKGNLSLASKDYEGAKKQFESAITLAQADAQKADALLGLARAARDAGDEAAARAALERLLKELPDSQQARVGEALLADRK